jgi:hypothetical protein
LQRDDTKTLKPHPTLPEYTQPYKRLTKSSDTLITLNLKTRLSLLFLGKKKNSWLPTPTVEMPLQLKNAYQPWYSVFLSQQNSHSRLINCKNSLPNRVVTLVSVGYFI